MNGRAYDTPPVGYRFRVYEYLIHAERDGVSKTLVSRSGPVQAVLDELRGQGWTCRAVQGAEIL